MPIALDSLMSKDSAYFLPTVYQFGMYINNDYYVNSCRVGYELNLDTLAWRQS